MKRDAVRARRAARNATELLFAEERAIGAPAHPIRAGIDEAGLGPMLGPLTLGACALRVPREVEDLWRALDSVVCCDARLPTRAQRGERRSLWTLGERIVVADSKIVFERDERGERRLERTALAFLALREGAPCSPSDARALLRSFPDDVCPLQPLEAEFWSSALAFALPRRMAHDELRADVDALRAACLAARIELLDAHVRTTAVRTLNDSFDATDNKARTHWQETRALIEHLWRRHASEGLELTVDRQGGRMRYSGVLAETFPRARVTTLSESAPCSTYDVVEAAREDGPASPARSMRIVFREKAELASFPVALASCLAKFVRETCMQAFNDWFAALDPTLRPTAGYYNDAQRWLADAQGAIERAQVDRRALVRSR